jgi:signal peptidase I
MEKSIYNNKYDIMNILYFNIILLLFLIIFNLLIISDYNVLSESIIEELNFYENNFMKIENIKNKSLNPFIELFDINSKYRYFPSYFLQSNIITYNNSYNSLEYMLHEQYRILYSNSNLMSNYMKEINNIHYTILNDYVNEVHDIVSQYQNLNDKTLLQLTTAIEKLGK